MKVKVDENLARSHKALLAEQGHDVTDVHEEGLAGHPDEQLWEAVCAEDRFLVTLDHDFGRMQASPSAQSAGTLLIRTSHPSASAVAAILQRVLSRPGGLGALRGSLAVADELRTRVRRVAERR